MAELDREDAARALDAFSKGVRDVTAAQEARQTGDEKKAQRLYKSADSLWKQGAKLTPGLWDKDEVDGFYGSTDLAELFQYKDVLNGRLQDFKAGRLESAPPSRLSALAEGLKKAVAAANKGSCCTG